MRMLRSRRRRQARHMLVGHHLAGRVGPPVRRAGRGPAGAETPARPPDRLRPGADSRTAIKVSMPSSAYSRSRAATVGPSPTSAVPAPPRTRAHARPQIGAISSRSRRPPCKGRHPALTFEIGAAQGVLGVGDHLVIQLVDQGVCCAPGFFGAVAHNHMHAQAKAQRAAIGGGALAQVGDFFSPPRPAARPSSGTNPHGGRPGRALPATSRQNTPVDAAG